MRMQSAFALIAVLASGVASADEPFGTTRARTAALYLEVPLGVRDRQNNKPVFGLRLQEARLAPFTLAGTRDFGSRTVLDVPLFQHNDDPLRDSGATMLLGKGLIVGIVIGAVVAVNALSDDDDDGGGY